MELFGIGTLELVTILIIIFIVMGPQDMVKMGGTLGRALRDFRRSGVWKSVNQASRQLRELPDTLMREVAGEEVEGLRQELKDEIDLHKGQLDDLNQQVVAWTRQPEPQSQKQTPPLNEAPDEDQADPAES